MDDPIPEGFELIACPNCTSSQSTPAHTGRDWALDSNRKIHVVRCNQCNLNYTNPRPDMAHLGAYYESDYGPYQKQRGEIERDSKSSTAIRTWVLAAAYGAPSHQPHGWHAAAAKIVSLIKSPSQFGFGVPYHGDGKLLDFGCGNGTFLRRMKAIGWHVTGVDMSDKAVAAVAASGIPAYQGTFPHPDIPAESFDVITMRQALEHVPQPRPVLEAALKLLRPSGKLVIEVPNFASWEIEYFGDAALTLDLPRHLLHWTPKTLHDVLASCGFQDIEVNQICRRSWLQKSMRQINRREKKKWDWLFKWKLACAIAARRAQKQGKGNGIIAVALKPLGALAPAKPYALTGVSI